MFSIINSLIPWLLTTILILCSLSTCALPPSEPLEETKPTVLPTPWQPWIVKNITLCILAKFGAEFIINNTKSETKFIPINPKTAFVGNDSKCGPDLQVLQLVFDGNSLSLSFEKNDQDVFVSEIAFKYGNGRSVVYNGRLFKTPLEFGYKCFEEQTFNLSDSIRMNVENVRLEAFKTHNYSIDDDMPEPWERVGLKCKLDRVESDAWKISGISVGVGVAVLSFITLVAIWSGRRQEKVMLKVKLMRQWTVEENLAYQARLGVTQNKKSPVSKDFPRSNQSILGIDNPGYANNESEKF